MGVLRPSALAAVLLATVACGAQTASPPTPTPLEDCRGGTAAPATPGVTYGVLTVDGKQRDYRVFTPASIGASKPIPLVIVIPPPQADAELIESLIHFDKEASKAGFISATPNGCNESWAYSPDAANIADEHFIGRMINQLETQFHVSAVYGVSASGGSRMLYRLACDLATQISAVADVAGSMILTDPCRPDRPVSILEIHGTADDSSPWQGDGPNGSYPVEDVNQRWRTLDGCTGDPVVSNSGITISSLWNHCSAPSVVRLDKVVGGKHGWFGPGDPDAVAGEPDANAVIAAFFSGLAARA